MKKTVVITGSSRGIGAATAKKFAENGYNIVINYNKSEEKALCLLDDLRKLGVNAVAIKADVSKRNDCEFLINKAISEFGKIDVLVNNVGIAQQKLFTDITCKDWQNMWNVNVSSAFYCTQFAVKDMLKRHEGVVLNVSSMWGVSGASCEVHYSASKSALIGFTKALAKELGPSNIRVNCVAPGVINTDMNLNISKEDMRILEQETPLMRTGEALEVADTIYFLCSDSSRFITGQVVNVDGGYCV